MLAKIWKKVLMAILIVACLFNITAKLVNKTSLETQLNGAKEGSSITDFIKDTNTNITDNTSTGNNVVNNDSNILTQ